MYFIVYIDSELAKRVFNKYLPDLSDLLVVPDNMSAVAPRLYGEDLIPKEAYDNITSKKSGHDKANSLLLALRATISDEPQSLKTLIEVLRRNKAFKAIADKMDEDVSSHISLGYVGYLTPPSSTPSQGNILTLAMSLHQS